MHIEALTYHYWFHNGKLISFHLDIQKDSVEIEIEVNKILKRKANGMIEDMAPCNLKIKMEDLIEVSLFDKFPTQGYYLNFSTAKLAKREVEISFNVHDSASYTYEKDNWNVRAKKIEWVEL